MAEQVSESPGYQGAEVFSYGFRPFFLGAALFAGGDPARFLVPRRSW
jgi:uncharacterized protein involved in response to NO